MSVDMFMKLKGKRSGDIKGEARDKVHKDEIDVLKWNWGMSASIDSGSGLRTGRANVQNFTFTKYIDKSSPVLISALLNNEELTEATLTCRRVGVGGGDAIEFLVIKFSKGSVAKIARNADHDADMLTEDITIAFQQCDENYTEITDKGKEGAHVSASFDIADFSTGG
jgi:type VI secretion system secreted protein Hcp